MEQKQTAKAPMSVRVTEKAMPLTKWFAEQYYQTHALMSKDPRYRTLPPYNQTSCIATVMIAVNGALDGDRARKRAEKLIEISKTEDQKQSA
jgi:hypothetical protein